MVPFCGLGADSLAVAAIEGRGACAAMQWAGEIPVMLLR